MATPAENWRKTLQAIRRERAEQNIEKAKINSNLLLSMHFGFICLLYYIITSTIPVGDLSQSHQGLSQYLYNTVSYSHLNGESGDLETVSTLDDAVFYSETLVGLLLSEAGTYRGKRLADEQLMYLRVHRLINSIVLVQRRVQKTDCSYPAMKPLYEDCYEGLDEHEQTSGTYTLTNGIEVEYSDKLQGFAVELPLNRSEALDMIDELKNGYFWDRATREAAVLFAFHNSPGHYTAQVKANFYASPFGLVEHQVQAQFMRLRPYSEKVNGPFFLWLQGMGIFLYLLLFAALVARVVAQPHIRWRVATCCDPWAMLEIASHALLWYSAYLWVAYIMDPARTSVDFTSPHFQNILHLGAHFQSYIFSCTAALLLWTVRLIQFFSTFKDKDTRMTSRVVEAILANMPYFCLILALVFTGFVFASHILFGPFLARFDSHWDAFGTLLLWFVALSGGQREMFDLGGGPFFLFFWILISMILLFNMFIALVMEAYAQVQEETEKELAMMNGQAVEDAEVRPKPLGHRIGDAICDRLGVPTYRLDPYQDPSVLKQLRDDEATSLRWNRSLDKVR